MSEPIEPRITIMDNGILIDEMRGEEVMQTNYVPLSEVKAVRVTDVGLVRYGTAMTRLAITKDQALELIAKNEALASAKVETTKTPDQSASDTPSKTPERLPQESA